MPGLCGLVSGGAPIDAPAETLKTFEKVHALNHAHFFWRSMCTSYVIIANALTGILDTMLDQPAIDPAGGTRLFLEGDVFNASELRALIRAHSGAHSVCEILLALFLERGPDFVTLVEGDFNIVICNEAERRLIILNDRMSSRPIYYLQDGDRLLFGSEIKSIQAVRVSRAAIDPVGILQVFAHRHNVGGRTFIQDVYRLPPASRLDYQEGRLTLTRYSLWKFQLPSSLPKIDTLVETWAAHLLCATTRRLEGKRRVVLSLSAGLDSRAIACAMPRDFRPVWARTRGYADSREVLYAAEIARCLGFNHFREDPDAVRYSDILPKVVWRTECAIPFINGLTMSNHAAIKQRGDFLLGGWLGDAGSGAHLSAFMFLPLGRKRFIESVYQWYLIYSEAALGRAFNPEFLRTHFPNVADAFAQSFDLLEGEMNSQVFEIWDLVERQARMTIGAGPVDSHLLEPVRPFFDGEYLDFLMTLPLRLRYGQVLYQMMIYQIGPEIRHVPNSNTNLLVKGALLGNLTNKGLAATEKVTGKIMSRVMPSQSKRVNRAALGNYSAAIRNDAELRHRVEDFARSSMFDDSIFNRQGILDMLNQHYSGAASHAYLLSLVATFAVGLPYFVYNRPRYCPPESEPVAMHFDDAHVHLNP